MERIFKEHYIRKTELLNGDWKFSVDKDDVGVNQQWFVDFPTDYRFVNVPSCWNLELDLADHFGIAWYSKEFFCEDCYLQIEFGAVSGLAMVYLDGEKLGEHYGGFTAFKFAKQVSSGMHTLTVRVDASSNKLNTIPLQEVDWYHYGGIIRSVEISKFTSPYITRHRISYQLDDALLNAELKAVVELYNPTDNDTTVPVKIEIGKYSCDSEVLVAAKSSAVFENNLTINSVKLWDIGNSQLYNLKISTDTDDIIDRIGFRKIHAHDKQIYLNNKPIFFKGVNRHEEHPDWGFAVPANITKRDIEIIKNLNCNIVRGAHYPQSKTLLDYLDREGIMFWSEIPMWGYPPQALADPLTIERGLTMHKEMVEQYFHHPSIVIWGLHNEIFTESNEAYEITKTFSQYVRSQDNSRLITYATYRFDKDICLEFTDFVSLNYYMGWYTGTLDEWDDFIKSIRGKMIEKGVGDKPVVMSEFGCGALFGFDDFSHNKWTMQYQSDFVEKVIKLSMQEDGFCGTFVWQFADLTSDININRARGFNNKGLLSEHRRPKTSYFTVKKLYSE